MPQMIINSPPPLRFYPIATINQQRPKKPAAKRRSPKKDPDIDSAADTTSLFSDYAQLSPVDAQTDIGFVDAVFRLYHKQKNLSDQYREIVKIQDSIVKEFGELLNKWTPDEMNPGMKFFTLY